MTHFDDRSTSRCKEEQNVYTITFANTQNYEWSGSDQHFAVGQQFGGVLAHSFDGTTVVNIPDVQAFGFIPGSENLVTTTSINIAMFNNEYSIGVHAFDGSVISPQIVYAGDSGDPLNISFSPDRQKFIFDFNGNGSSDRIICL